MTQKRIVILIGVLGFVGASVVAGWMAGSRIQSPADAAARTAPPAPSPILVPVESRVLSSSIVTRGTARFGLPEPVSIAPSDLKPHSGLITTVPVRNSQLKEGSLLLTASGRPVFVLRGQIPAYRDLGPGISGPDVAQLEQALQRLLFDPGAMDGVYDDAMADAVAAWYEASGWEPFGPTKDQLAAVKALDLELGEARKTESAALSSIRAAALELESARATAEHDNRMAAADLAARTSERSVVLLDPQQTQSARASAEANLAQAQAGVKAAQLAGDKAIQAALEFQKVAEIDAGLATARVRRLEQELAVVQSRLGVQVPVDEIVFLASLPVRVEEVAVRVGDEARGRMIAVTDNQLSIDASLSLDAAPLVRPGMNVAIDEQALGIKARGTVIRVADTPGTHGVDGYHVYFETRVHATATPLQGVSLRLTIPIESTDGAVTAVPVSAVSLAADGTSRVQVERGGTLNYVRVEPGMAADGFVAVAVVGDTLSVGELVVVGYESPVTSEVP
jgi:hypothetical protein